MEKRTPLRNILGFLHSMKLGIAVLLLIAAACVAGSLILQDQIPAYYEANYGAGAARWILALQLDHVFRCWWFLLLSVFLCVNLALCSVLRVGAVLAYRGRRQARRFGAWLCHVGMLLLIAGFGLGQRFSLETYLYGVKGETREIEGTDYAVRIDDFQIELREDETVKQYTASLTVYEKEGGRSVSGAAEVNAPLDAFGMRLYQNSTGWACQVDVYHGETLEETRLLCVGEALTPPSRPELSLVFQKFYPDFADTDEGPVSRSSRLDNPCAGFLLYYDGELVAGGVVGVEYDLIAEPYRFVFRDPQAYTLIQVIRDPFRWLAALGGLVVLVSLVLCFYGRPGETEDKACARVRSEETEAEACSYGRPGETEAKACSYGRPEKAAERKGDEEE